MLQPWGKIGQIFALQDECVTVQRYMTSIHNILFQTFALFSTTLNEDTILSLAVCSMLYLSAKQTGEESKKIASFQLRSGIQFYMTIENVYLTPVQWSSAVNTDTPCH